ncbi:MAG: hypothetical protein ACKO9B_16845 [Planctomycetota bacterium]
MPSVHAAAARQSLSEKTDSRTWAWIALAVLALAAIAGAVWWWWSSREDPRIVEFRQFTQDLAKQYPPTDAPKGMLDMAARVTAAVGWFGKLQALPEHLRKAAFKEGEKVMMASMKAKIDGYFTTPPDKRQDYLDQQINGFDSMRKLFEGNRSQFASMLPKGQGGPGGQGSGGAPQGPPRSRSEEDRNAWRKNMLDRSTPQDRARFNEFFGAVERRMRERGMTPGGGPRR